MKWLVFLVPVASAIAAFDQSKLDKSSFFEQFDYESLAQSPWIPSDSRKFDDGRKEEVAYKGQWKIEPSFMYPGDEAKKGLVIKSRAAHYAIARKLNTPFNNTDTDLVLQYEVKLQDPLKCGGAYVKLLDAGHDYTSYNSETPFQIMFGPDICGSNNKVHFIINRENPVDGTIGQKNLRTAPMGRTGQLSTLYTLILKDNNDLELRINGETAKAGNLVTTPFFLEPPLNPVEEIVDEKDTKPLSWDDEQYIPDPKFAKKKPEDYKLKHVWKQIPDTEAVKPQDWNEDEELFIENPEASKPANWDDEEDGVWLAPEIRNPKCEGISGCGKWKAPMIHNPHYIGPWVQPKIENPNYRGEWEPRNIPNPVYFDDNKPSNLNKEIGAIAFELWSMESNILFDNIYLGHSVAEAEMIGNTTWKPKYELEAVNREQNKPKVKHEPVRPPPNFDELMADKNQYTITQFYEFIKVFLWKLYLETKDFVFEFMQNPVDLIVEHPIKFSIYCGGFVILFTVIFGAWGVLLFVVSNAFSGDNQKAPTTAKNGEKTAVNSRFAKIEELSDEDAAEQATTSARAAPTAFKRK